MLAAGALKLQHEAFAGAVLLLRAIVRAFREISAFTRREITEAGALNARERITDLIEIMPVARREIAVGHDRQRIFHGDAFDAGFERQSLAANHVNAAAANFLEVHGFRIAND